MSDVAELQQDRTDRARAALANGELKLTPVAGGGWLTVNGDGKQYFISHDLESCNCPDYEQRGRRMGFRCKHLEAARMLFAQPHIHKEIKVMEATQQENGWMKLWHPRAVQVTIPVTPCDPAIMLSTVSAYLDAGWLADAPGLDEGEMMEEISAVAKREGKDSTPIIDFYSSNTKLNKKFMHAYMNSPEDMQAFEDATGLRLSDIAIYDGNVAIARDDSKAGKYIKQLLRPIKLVFRINPRWTEWKNGDGTGQEPHKRLLVRYEASANGKTPVTGPLASSAPAAPVAPASTHAPGDIERAKLVIVTGGSPAVNGKALGDLITSNRPVVEWLAGEKNQPKDANGETIKKAARLLLSVAA